MSLVESLNTLIKTVPESSEEEREVIVEVVNLSVKALEIINDFDEENSIADNISELVKMIPGEDEKNQKTIIDILGTILKVFDYEENSSRYSYSYDRHPYSYDGYNHYTSGKQLGVYDGPSCLSKSIIESYIEDKEVHDDEDFNRSIVEQNFTNLVSLRFDETFCGNMYDEVYERFKEFLHSRSSNKYSRL